MMSTTTASPAQAQNAAGTQAAGRTSVMSMAIKEKAALYAAYMPFIKGGGIFVPTTRVANLGDSVYVMLQLMDDPTKMPLAGKVVWISPSGIAGKQAGLGIQFPSDPSGEKARMTIEQLIGTALKATRPTHTI
jgi:type IV pilus assembly protein PilZ